MRLINTNTLQFKDFDSREWPKYAILSHRWGDGEVSYKEMRKGTAPAGPGLTKIERFCKLAATRDLEWAWIDTCCIDKGSSAELSEAINSMFKWYQNCFECYVHLGDVEYSPEEMSLMKAWGNEYWSAGCWPRLESKFGKSSWFSRGWTLQELVAPNKSRTFFFDASWNMICNLPPIVNDVSRVTGIQAKYLTNTSGSPPIASASVAKRMSWASRREASREEDMAYCLLGIFDINMPLLYGEGGEKAFFRLQVEIMNKTDDESLFAWTSSRIASGMFAAHPSNFVDSGDIEPFSDTSWLRPPYSMTNKGIAFSVPRDFMRTSMKPFIVRLNCSRKGTQAAAIGIELVQVNEISVRVRCNILKSTLTTPSHNRHSIEMRYRDTEILYAREPNKNVIGLVSHALGMNQGRQIEPPHERESTKAKTKRLWQLYVGI